MRKFIFIFFIFFIAGFSTSFANTCEPPKQTMNNVCQNTECTKTERIKLNGGESIYILEGKIYDINDISSSIDQLIENYISYYGGNKTVNNFCDENDYSECENKNIKIKDILKIDKKFNKNGKDYIDGLDYFFKNPKDIFKSTYGNNWGIDLSSFVPNAISYSYNNNKNKHGFIIKNVCSNNKCTETKEETIYYENSNDIRIVNGYKVYEKVPSRKEIEMIDYSLSTTKIKAGEEVKVGFSFLDEMFGTSCDTLEYKYKIRYSYNGGTSSGFLEDSFVLNKNGELIDTGNAGVSKVDNNYGNGLVRIDINEYFVMLESGEVTFSFDFEDNFGNIEPEKVINSNYPVKVIASEPSSEKSILKFDDYLDDVSYFEGVDRFEAKLFLKDDLGNDINEEDGIYVGFGGDKSEYIYNGDPDVSDEDFSKLEESVVFISNEGLISTGSIDKVFPEVDTETNETFYRINFYFSEKGEYKKKFLVRVNDKDINGTTISNSFSYAYASDDGKSSYKIQPIIKSDVLDIHCSRTVHLKAKCIFDGTSKCKPEDENFRDEIIYDSEDYNPSSGILYSEDNGGHTYLHPYIMDHVDRTIPIIKYNYSDFPLELDFENEGVITNLKASAINNIKLRIIDPGLPSGCIESSQIKYSVLLNGTVVQTDTLDGVILDIDINNDVFNFFSTAGLGKTFELVFEDFAGNTNSLKKTYNIYPTDIGLDPTGDPDDDGGSDPDNNIDPGNGTGLGGITFEIVGGGNDKYADGKSFYDFQLIMKDRFNNGIYGKTVKLINQTCGIFSDNCNTLTSNENSNSGFDVLFEEGYENIVSNEDGIIPFTVRSLVPGDFMESFNIQIEGWNNVYNNLGGTTINVEAGSNEISTFLNPISVKIDMADPSSEPLVGILQEYVLNLFDETTDKLFETLTHFKDGYLDIDTTSISFKSPHSWYKVSPIIRHFGNNISTQLGFSGSIDVIGGGALNGINMISDRVVVNYNIEGKDVSYFLTGSSLEGCERETLGLEVIGNLQGDGKGEITGQVMNFSDISKGEIRSQVRSNGYNLIKNRQPHISNIVNGVKFVEGDISISGNNLGYETLIVKNGNVIIEGDLNTLGDKLGIIVLKDNYLIDSDYENMGNIYVLNNVSQINAIIYADGAFRSSNAYGISYSDTELINPLELNGTLFTRNTIGGAITGNTEYTLPGGEGTDNSELAEIYDLNYVRKVADCNSSSFIIRYDSSIQTDPPKGFINQ